VALSTGKYFGYMQGFKVRESILNEIINYPITEGIEDLIFHILSIFYNSFLIN